MKIVLWKDDILKRNILKVIFLYFFLKKSISYKIIYIIYINSVPPYGTQNVSIWCYAVKNIKDYKKLDNFILNYYPHLKHAC